MKNSLPNPRCLRAFTLIELLVVIAIIGILAALLFPALGRAKLAAQKAAAKQEMIKLGSAIKSYESDYNGRLPAPGIDTGSADVTYGLSLTRPGSPSALKDQQIVANNSNVVAVLMNWEKFPNGVNTLNVGKAYNPRGLTPLTPTLAKDAASGGVGTDGEYRDPWGNSFVISMDTSLDDQCLDLLYARTSFSQESGQKGFYGLNNPKNVPDGFGSGGQYLIWSRGPDGKFDVAKKANAEPNKDNVLGWQE
jgi:prepilin-type N-terminal cleavage/methylation domain-containing protein